MRRIRMAIGVTLILGGMALGLYVGFHFVAAGMTAMSNGSVALGLLQSVFWSELFGIAASLALIIPGVWVLQRGVRKAPSSSGL